MTRIKCTECNIVINEVLCFVQNKIDVMNNVSLTLLCRQSFTEEEIAEAKSLLFDSVKQRRVKRRGDEGKNKNIEDIIGLLKGAEPEIFPTFVARDLQKLPPVTFDHVDATRILKDLIVMRSEISSLNEKCAFFEEMYVKKDDLKQEMETYYNKDKDFEQHTINYHNVNCKRGGYCLQDSPDCNSGPMGLMTVREDGDKLSMTEQNQIDVSLSLSKASAAAERTDTSIPVAPIQNAAQALVDTPGLATMATNLTVKTVNAAPMQSAVNMTSPEAIRPAQSADDVHNKDDEEWIQVRKRKVSKFKGMRGTAAVDRAEKFKAAEAQIPMFIYNVSKEVTEQDVAEYVLNKMHVKVAPVKVINNKFEKDYNSFKFLIPKNKLSLFTNNESWPEGIYFRKYIRFNKEKKAYITDRDSKTKL